MNRNNWQAALILVLILGTAASGVAQAPPVDPGELGFDVEILGEINTLMSEAVQQGRLVGCNAMILKDDQICYYGQWGQQSREDQLPVQRDTIWRIYSMSKPITSVAVMQLVESGRLDLDAPVSRYIPAFQNMKVLQEKDGEFTEVDVDRPFTVRDLLRHSAGLTYGFFGNSEVDQRYRKAGILMSNPDLQSLVEALGELPLKHQPGDRFEYSVATDVLGHLVEVASGERFDEYLSKNLFVPLHMQDTGFTVPQNKQDRFAAMYRPTREGALEPSPKLASLRYLNPKNRFYSGGGGLCSSIDDYMQFCRMLLNQGQLDEQEIITPETLRAMWTNQLGDLKRNSDGFQFGLGFSISAEGDYAWGGAAGTRFWVNPEKNLAMIYMVQINPYRQRFGEQMRQIVYRALQE